MTDRGIKVMRAGLEGARNGFEFYIVIGGRRMTGRKLKVIIERDYRL